MDAALKHKPIIEKRVANLVWFPVQLDLYRLFHTEAPQCGSH